METPAPNHTASKAPHAGPKEDRSAGQWGASLPTQQHEPMCRWSEGCPCSGLLTSALPIPGGNPRPTSRGGCEQANPGALDGRPNRPRQALKPAAGQTCTHISADLTATSPSSRACPSTRRPQAPAVPLWLQTWGPQAEADPEAPPRTARLRRPAGAWNLSPAQAGGKGLDEPPPSASVGRPG